MKINKKWIILASIGLIIILGIFLLLTILNKKELTKNNISSIKSYTAYININPLIKFTFFHELKNNKLTSDFKILNYELINKDAKLMFKDYNFKDMEFGDALEYIRKTVKEKGVIVDKVEIYSDYKKIEDYISEKYDEAYIENFEINIKNSYELEDLEELLTAEKELYTVYFTTDGGTKITNQILEKGSKVKIPNTPIKEGYKFVEWRLNGEKYDFNSEITKDIELRAVWETVEDTATTTKQTTTTKQITTTKPSIKSTTTTKTTTTQTTTVSTTTTTTTKKHEEKVLGSYPLPKRTDECVTEYDDWNGETVELVSSKWFHNQENLLKLLNDWINYYGYFYTDTKYVYIAEQIYLEFNTYGRFYIVDEKCQPLAAHPIYTWSDSNPYIKNYLKTYKVGNESDIGALLPELGYKVKCTTEKCWEY